MQADIMTNLPRPKLERDVEAMGLIEDCQGKVLENSINLLFGLCESSTEIALMKAKQVMANHRSKLQYGMHITYRSFSRRRKMKVKQVISNRISNMYSMVCI
jgi:hypothetical protein